ncbi:MAG: hypothetical protein CVT74_05905 [Alphaproteobacteria bacterium HGW-Alphaproteobacteria-13]|jgi:hypothetical protein|nr:MAG: hypothetical protein CVT74_05905 [Alphaproteobacteria bacterium HGW-Alphaproteobacteria-13]
MQNNPAGDGQSNYEWHRCSVIWPRIGLLLNRDGIRTRLLLPGQYLVRMSRSLRQRIYRRPPAARRGEWG